MSFSLRIKKWRKKNKLTQQQSSAILNVPMRSFQSWDAGENEPHNDRKTVIEKRMKDYEFEVPNN